MEESAIKTTEYVLANPDVSEIIANFAKVRDTTNYIIFLHLVNLISCNFKLFVFVSYLKFSEQCDPPCLNGGTCNKDYGLCFCKTGCSGDQCQVCESTRYDELYYRHLYLVNLIYFYSKLFTCHISKIFRKM